MVEMESAGTEVAAPVEPVLAAPVLAGLLIAGAASVAMAARLASRMRRGLPVVEPRPHPAATWNGSDVALIATVYLGLLIGAGMFVNERSTLRLQLAADIVTKTAATLAGLGLLRAAGASWAAIGFTRGHRREDLALAVGGLALVLAPLLLLAAALNRIVPYRHSIVSLLQAQRDPVAIALAVLAAVVVAPIAEEFFFRRALQGWLESRVPDGDGAAAIGVSAAAFAAAHVGQGLAAAPLFLFGVVLGVLARQTGSLAACVALHALFNAVGVGLLLAAPAGVS